MEKILTIVIPTYNMQNYLRRCLDSLIVPEEQMKQLEVLVINDGSKDNSSAIAHEYQDKYSDTFRVIDKENGNYGSCVNRGLKEATGKYIKILDADDRYANEVLGDFIQLLSRINVDLVLNGYVRLYASFSVVEPIKLPIDKICSFSDLSQDEVDNLMMHTNTYRRNIFEGLDYHQTEGVSYSDREWDTIPLLHVKTVYNANLNLYLYSLDREGQTMAPATHLKRIGDEIKCNLAILKAIVDKNTDSYRQTFNKSKKNFFNVYKFVLFDNLMFKNDELRQMDKEVLALSKTLWTELDKEPVYSFIHYNYIHHWRNKAWHFPIVIFCLKQMWSFCNLFRHNKY